MFRGYMKDWDKSAQVKKKLELAVILTSFIFDKYILN